MVTAKVSPQELITLDKLIREKGICPNQVSDVYKVRRGRFNDVRIWTEMDLGTCRMKDLFITDVNFKPILDFYPMSFVFEDIEDTIQSILDLLNNEGNEKIETPSSSQEGQEIISLKTISKTNPENWVL